MFFQFFCFHKSHSSSPSFTQFQHSGVVEMIFIHFSLHLFGLSVVQLYCPSSHFSFHSLLLFQHTAVVLVHSKEHLPLYQLYIQLSHSSHTSVFPFQQLTEHFVQRSIGHVRHVSPGSIFQLPQFGNRGLYVVQEAVQALPFIQLLFHKSHSSYSSFILSQHSWFESTILQYSEHFPSHQFHAQLSHSSPGSTIQLPHELVNFKHL